MPFRSKAQVRACHAKDDPNWNCSEFAAATPSIAALPERKKRKKTAAAPPDGDLVRQLQDASARHVEFTRQIGPTAGVLGAGLGLAGAVGGLAGAVRGLVRARRGRRIRGGAEGYGRGVLQGTTTALGGTLGAGVGGALGAVAANGDPAKARLANLGMIGGAALGGTGGYLGGGAMLGKDDDEKQGFVQGLLLGYGPEVPGYPLRKTAVDVPGLLGGLLGAGVGVAGGTGLAGKLVQMLARRAGPVQPLADRLGRLTGRERLGLTAGTYGGGIAGAAAGSRAGRSLAGRTADIVADQVKPNLKPSTEEKQGSVDIGALLGLLAGGLGGAAGARGINAKLQRALLLDKPMGQGLAMAGGGYLGGAAGRDLLKGIAVYDGAKPAQPAAPETAATEQAPPPEKTGAEDASSRSSLGRDLGASVGWLAGAAGGGTLAGRLMRLLRTSGAQATHARAASLLRGIAPVKFTRDVPTGGLGLSSPPAQAGRWKGLSQYNDPDPFRYMSRSGFTSRGAGGQQLKDLIAWMRKGQGTSRTERHNLALLGGSAGGAVGGAVLGSEAGAGIEQAMRSEQAPPAEKSGALRPVLDSNRRHNLSVVFGVHLEKLAAARPRQAAAARRIHAGLLLGGSLPQAVRWALPKLAADASVALALRLGRDALRGFAKAAMSTCGEKSYHGSMSGGVGFMKDDLGY